MNSEMIVKAWKSPEYRASLLHEQRAALPENPSGRPLTELDDSDLDDVTGGEGVKLLLTERNQCCLFSLGCPSLAQNCNLEI
ncbi:mersacidin/lichenicidin family type 2 lantibiotic [Archangium violaceum]|uniref:mersacidin/lichenicidin family type 2 lantibiotic n=1 Tax=Archangium violaceum TaxID=83451 RepID=UPI00194FD25E|nr:mersacidin/lichenicidin family type 2 lantibiotic [Archangium violaceum]QRN94428.1 mersacidin/lichenicidin family type 2 lantibiotic [Archangium violaceum]